MDFLLLLGILLSIALIIYASFNKYSVLLSAPLATIVVVAFSGASLQGGILGKEGSYSAYLTGFIFDFFFIFVLGSIMAKYLQQSGAIDAISAAVIRIIGADKPLNGMISVFLITSLLTYGGISLFVVMFAAVPLARSLFSQMKIPWKLAPVPLILGLGTYTASMVPGSPSLINMIPTKTLNTTLMAAPAIGIVTSLVTIVASILIMGFLVKREMKGTSAEDPANVQIQGRADLPGILISVLPLLALVAILVAGSLLKVNNILIIALAAVIGLEMILFRPYISSHVEVLNAGTVDALVPLFSTASTVAFGQYIANIGLVSDLTKRLIGFSSAKLLMASLVTLIFAIITGSASGAVRIVMASQGSYLLGLGLDPDQIHRVIAIASTLMPNAPHCGVVLVMLSLTKLTHKESYLYIFTSTAIVGLLALGIALLMTSF